MDLLADFILWNMYSCSKILKAYIFQQLTNPPSFLLAHKMLEIIIWYLIDMYHINQLWFIFHADDFVLCIPSLLLNDLRGRIRSVIIVIVDFHPRNTKGIFRFMFSCATNHQIIMIVYDMRSNFKAIFREGDKKHRLGLFLLISLKED